MKPWYLGEPCSPLFYEMQLISWSWNLRTTSRSPSIMTTPSEAILLEVIGQIFNLSFDFLRRTYQLSGLKETRHQSLTEFFVILQHVFRQLAQTVERMGSAPHHRLRKVC